jgi:hypothetical protein
MAERNALNALEAQVRPRSRTLGERASDAVDYVAGPRTRGNSLASRTQEAVDAAGAAGASLVDPFGATSALLGLLSPEGKELMRQQQEANSGASFLGGLLPLLFSGGSGLAIGAARNVGKKAAAENGIEIANRSISAANNSMEGIRNAQNLTRTSPAVSQFDSVPLLLNNAEEGLAAANSLGRTPYMGTPTLAAAGIGAAAPAGVSFVEGERDPEKLAMTAAMGGSLGVVGERVGANLTKGRMYGEAGMRGDPYKAAADQRYLTTQQGDLTAARRAEQELRGLIDGLPSGQGLNAAQPRQPMASGPQAQIQPSPSMIPQAVQQPVPQASLPSPANPSQTVQASGANLPSRRYNQSDNAQAQQFVNDLLDGKYGSPSGANVGQVFQQKLGDKLTPGLSPENFTGRMNTTGEKLAELARRGIDIRNPKIRDMVLNTAVSGRNGQLAVPGAIAGGAAAGAASGVDPFEQALAEVKQVFLDIDGDGVPDVAVPMNALSRPQY